MDAGNTGQEAQMNWRLIVVSLILGATLGLLFLWWAIKRVLDVLIVIIGN